MENYISKEESLSPKESIKRIKLPIKTKIAAWWIIIYGIAYSSYKIFDIYYFHKTREIPEGVVILGYPPLSEVIIPIILAILFYSLIGAFLLKKKRIAWYFAVVILSIFLISNLFNLSTITSQVFQEGLTSLNKLHFTFLFNFLSMLIPVGLLIIDRKNFFSITS